MQFAVKEVGVPPNAKLIEPALVNATQASQKGNVVDTAIQNTKIKMRNTRNTTGLSQKPQHSFVSSGGVHLELRSPSLKNESIMDDSSR